MTRKHSNGGRLALRLGLSGGVAAALLFTGLWTLGQLPMGPSDLIVGLFTASGSTSMDALIEGVLYAALIGFFGGALVALAYRGLEFVESR